MGSLYFFMPWRHRLRKAWKAVSCSGDLIPLRQLVLPWRLKQISVIHGERVLERSKPGSCNWLRLCEGTGLLLSTLCLSDSALRIHDFEGAVVHCALQSNGIVLVRELCNMLAQRG